MVNLRKRKEASGSASTSSSSKRPRGKPSSASTKAAVAAATSSSSSSSSAGLKLVRTQYVPRSRVVSESTPVRALDRESESRFGDGEANSVSQLRARVLARLGGSCGETGASPSRLVEQSTAFKGVLNRCLTHGESNAVLLMGAPGTGKSLLLNRALKALKVESQAAGRSFLEVHLSGLVHTDDVMALRAMCHQLRVENDLELLRERGFLQLATVVTDLLRHTSKVCPVIVVLDDFDQFAQRPKQTLLYTLSDMLQSPHIWMAVVGMTARLDAYELLEKRVRSRISYRRIVVPRVTEWDCLVGILSRAMQDLDPIEVVGEEEEEEEDVQKKKEKKKTPPRQRRRTRRGKQEADEDSDEDEEMNGGEFSLAAYRRSVQKVMESERVFKALHHHFEVGRSPAWFLTVCMHAVSQLREDAPFLTVPRMLASITQFSSDRLLKSLASCSMLELAMVAAMLQLEKQDVVPYNFALVFKEYDSTVRRVNARSVDIHPRAICLGAFERLIDLQLLERTGNPTCSRGTTAGKEYQCVRLLPDPSQVARMFASDDVSCPAWLRQWGARWLS